MTHLKYTEGFFIISAYMFN